MMAKADSTPRPSARSTARRKPDTLFTQACPTADTAAPRGARRRTSRTRADPNKATAAEEEARVGQVASMARGGDYDRKRSRRGDRERSRRGERGRW